MDYMKTLTNTRNGQLASWVAAALSLALSGGATALLADENQYAHPCGKEMMGPEQCAPTIKPTAYNKAGSLIGMKVINPQGQVLGTIKDLVVDLQSEQVSYAVLAQGGFLGSKQKFHAVPLSALRPANADQLGSLTWPAMSYPRLVLNADKKSLDLAQGFPANQWPSVSNPSWGAEPIWKDSSATERSTGTDLKAAKPMKIRESKPAPPELYPPGSLGYPGW
jgi:sporulation protein YlmC with PRC-barrel domain